MNCALSDTSAARRNSVACSRVFRMDSELDSLHMYDSADIAASANIVKPKLKPLNLLPHNVANLDDIALNAVVDLDPSGELYFDVQGFMDTVIGANRRPESLLLPGLTAASPSAAAAPMPVAQPALSPVEQRVPAARWPLDSPTTVTADFGKFSTNPATAPQNPYTFHVLKREPFVDMVSSTTGIQPSPTYPMPDSNNAAAVNWGCEPAAHTVTAAAADCSSSAKVTPPARKTPSRKRCLSKDSDEYRSRRARNNVAVRKSRDKTKQRHLDSETRVHQLANENDMLRRKVELLSRELGVLRTLFANVGIEWSPIVQQLLDEAS